MQYYDGTKLLSLKDIDGNEPEIFMVTTNKTGGKTTFFTKMCVKKFVQNASKFMMLYRFNYELDNCADKIFKDVGSLFFPNLNMTSKSKSKGIYHELYLNNVPCGYAVAINSVDQIKKMSHLFSDTDRIMFDEFQSETNHYCSDEVNKFRAIHTAVARGRNKQARYVPVYMCANPVTILNPYYVAMGISSRIKDDTKFLRGSGFVLEQGYVDSAAKAQQNSGFNKAFGNDSYSQYQMQAKYLNDSRAFIEKPSGTGNYLATLKYKGKNYAIREYSELGIIYCDDRADNTFPLKISLTTDDHQINYIMLRNNDGFLYTLRYYFEKGCFRFKDLLCKDAVLTALSY